MYNAYGGEFPQNANGTSESSYSFPEDKSLKQRINSSFDKYIVTNKPIDFDKYKPLLRASAEELLKGKYWFKTKHMPLDVRFEVERTRTFLEYWDRLRKGPALLCKEEILYRTLTEGPSFYEYFKKLRQGSFIATSAIEGCHDVPIEYMEKIESVDQIPPVRFLLHYEEVDPKDYLYSLIPEPEYTSEQEEEFKTALCNLFDEFYEEIEFPTELEMLIGNIKNAPNSKVADLVFNKLSKKSTLKGVPAFVEKVLVTDRNPQPPYFGKRVLVRPYPGGVRDVVEPTKNTRDALRAIRPYLATVVACMNYSCHVNDDDLWYKRFKFTNNKKYAFIMMDIKKCGHSIPKKLQSWCIDILEYYWPEAPWEIIRDILDVTVEYGKGDTGVPHRGFCLGWLNEIATMIQCTLLQVLNNRRYEEDHIKKACFFNDDSVIGIEIPNNDWKWNRGDWSQSTLRHIHQEFSDVVKLWTEFGIILNRKYTCAGTKSVFCEIYSDPRDSTFGTQKTYLAAGILAKMRHVHIPFAKEMLKASSNFLLSDESYKDLLSEVIDLKGYEIHECEKDIPVRLGGWKVPLDLDGLNHDCVEIETLTPLELFVANELRKIEKGFIPKPSTMIERHLGRLRTKDLTSYFKYRGRKVFTDEERTLYQEIIKDISEMQFSEESYYQEEEVQDLIPLEDHG